MMVSTKTSNQRTPTIGGKLLLKGTGIGLGVYFESVVTLDSKKMNCESGAPRFSTQDIKHFRADLHKF